MKLRQVDQVCGDGNFPSAIAGLGACKNAFSGYVPFLSKI